MNLPEMKSVSSSNVDSVGYNSETSELFVKFKTGAVYKYLAVPETEFDKLVGADSVGCYLNRTIKNSYAVERVS